MIASFSIVPIGVGEELRTYVADILSIVEQSGIDYRLGAMNTTVEGDTDQVMTLIMRCHRRMAELAPRVLTNITIDDRRGASGRIKGKVADVEKVLGRELKHG